VKKDNTHIVYLGLGTNLGNKEANLKEAIEEIRKRVGEVTSLSAFYATEPWGFESEHSFLNAVCRVSTTFSPLEVLHITQEIERSLGRIKKSINRQSPRQEIRSCRGLIFYGPLTAGRYVW